MSDSNRYPDMSDSNRYPDMSDSNRYPDMSDSNRYPDMSDSNRYPDMSDSNRYPDMSALSEQECIIGYQFFSLLKLIIFIVVKMFRMNVLHIINQKKVKSLKYCESDVTLIEVRNGKFDYLTVNPGLVVQCT